MNISSYTWVKHVLKSTSTCAVKREAILEEKVYLKPVLLVAI